MVCQGGSSSRGLAPEGGKPIRPWRVVIVARTAQVARSFRAIVRAAGHQPVAFMTVREDEFALSSHSGGF